MTPPESAFTQFLSAHGHDGLPWQAPVDELRAAFEAGWRAHASHLQHTHMFGSLEALLGAVGLKTVPADSANVAQPAEQPLRKRSVVGANPAVGSISDKALAIYAAYPRHVGKQAALRAIEKAARALAKPDKSDRFNQVDPYAFLLERTQSYAAAVAQWPADEKRFIPHPATWYNRASYCDDPKEWERGQPAKASQFKLTR